MLLKVKILGHEIDYNTKKTNQFQKCCFSKNFLTDEVALMSFIGALNLDTKFLETLHGHFQPFYDLLLEKITWNCSSEHKFQLQQIKSSLTSVFELTIPNTKHPFLKQSMIP